jgi:hypothetical protein
MEAQQAARQGDKKDQQVDDRDCDSFHPSSTEGQREVY